MKLTHAALLASTTTILALCVTASADATAADRNRDRIPDRWEVRHGLSLRVDQRRRDQDHDGLNNLYEYRSGTLPKDANSDDDRLRDGAEDVDRDRLTNHEEQVANTMPRDRDSDDDGTADADEDNDHDGLSNDDEFELGDDPNRGDSDGDGTRDGNEVSGIVVSFDGATLVLRMLDGTTRTLSVSSHVKVSADDRERSGDDPAPSDATAVAPGTVVKELELETDTGEVTEIEIARGTDDHDD